MKVILLLLCASVTGLAASVLLAGWSDLILIFGPSTLASVILLAKRAFAAPQTSAPYLREPESAPNAAIRPKRHKIDVRASKQWAIIDGSNVMHWQDGAPSLDPVKKAIQILSERGYTAGVMFDANAGHKLFGKYRHDHAMAKSLGLPEERIMVVPKGTPADPYILTAARDLSARIVTNDRFRDWAEEFPEIKRAGLLISGSHTRGTLRLNLGA